ncbi:DUF975 family protein [Dysosmobacter sp.]
MMFAADFRQAARDALRGRWGLAVGTGLLAGILGCGSLGAWSGGSVSFENRISQADLESVVSYETWLVVRPVLLMLLVALVIWAVVAVVIGGTVTMGYAKFNLNLVDRRDARLDDLFSRFSRLGDGFCMQFFRGLYIFLWSLLLIVPGIMAAYSYAMTPFILTENPDMTANEAISASKELMRGSRWRLFCLEFSFIGWGILCVLTLGIGSLWLKPYEQAAYAAFYREISGTAPPDGAAEAADGFL